MLFAQPCTALAQGAGREWRARVSGEQSKRLKSRTGRKGQKKEDVIEVGGGTGISLPRYAPHLRIFGTDISEAMLEKAKKRVGEFGLKNVEGLAVMDAENLEFPDDSFDVVMAQYVVTAVPNPEKALDEFARVLRPGGELIILTRVSADTGMRRCIEQKLQPVVRPLGFRTAEVAWARYAKWLAGAHGIELAERRLIPPLG